MNKVKLGVSTLSWMNSDIPSLGEGIPVEQSLTEAAEIGYLGVELEDPMRKILSKLPKLLKDLNIKCAAGWHSTFLLQKPWETEIESLRRHLEVLNQIGAGMVNLAECSGAVHRQSGVSLLTRPKLDDYQLRVLAELLERMTNYIHEQGFKTAYHHHMGTVIQDGDDIRRLMSHTENLGLLYDSGHLYFAGEDPIKILREHAHRITHVHMKNIRPENLNREGDFFSAILGGTFTVPGDGLGIDFGPVVNALIQSEYEGWVFVEAEQDPNKADPYSYAELGFRTMSGLLN